jgi:hypothetical protein
VKKVNWISPGSPYFGVKEGEMRLAARLGGKDFGGYDCHSCLIKIQKKADDRILVNFTMKGSEQEGGSLEMSQATARWLAKALFSATDIAAVEVEISAVMSREDLRLGQDQEERSS